MSKMKGKIVLMIERIMKEESVSFDHLLEELTNNPSNFRDKYRKYLDENEIQLFGAETT
jgi:hypothetical protein